MIGGILGGVFVLAMAVTALIHARRKESLPGGSGDGMEPAAAPNAQHTVLKTHAHVSQLLFLGGSDIGKRMMPLGGGSGCEDRNAAGSAFVAANPMLQAHANGQ